MSFQKLADGVVAATTIAGTKPVFALPDRSALRRAIAAT
jgi:hypothetical protein